MDEYTRPDREHAALLTIDTQRDFTREEGSATIPGTNEAAGTMQHVTRQFREQGSPIVHVVRLYRSDGSNADLCRRAGIEDGDRVAIPGSDGAELVDEITPAGDVSLDTDRLLDGEFQRIGDDETVMYKPRWGAFYDTGLEERLRAADIDTVVVCGCNFPNCPRTTIYEASERDFRVIVVTDALSGLYERGREELRDIGVHLMDADEFGEWFNAENTNSGH